MKLKQNNLKTYREKSNLTQEKLAELVNVSRQTVISIENDRYIPSLPLALKFADLYKCNVKDLFNI